MAFYYPQGIILPFDENCPTGWTRVTELDDKFLKGSDTHSDTGGSTNHRHNVDYGTVYSSDASGSGVDAEPGANAQGSVEHDHNHYFIDYTAWSNYADHIPPYVNVVFCKKD
jgi:hypothetical protein